MIKLLAAVLVWSICLTAGAWAKTIVVTAGGSIQAEIDRAESGDTVLVEPGNYSSFDINRDGITVRSVVPGGAHVIATEKGRPAVSAYGRNNIAVLDFRLTSRHGDGVKIGGSVRKSVRNIRFEGNIVEESALDGLKFFQVRDLFLIGNTIRLAGTSRNDNGDGGIDFVGVDHSTVRGNRILETFGHACLMIKGGSNHNTVTGNVFMGCERDGITVGGFTSEKFMDPSDNGLEAYGNTITGNDIQAGKCGFYRRKEADNRIAGNTVASDRCSDKDSQVGK